MKYIFLVNIVFALLYAIVTTVSYNVAVTPGDSYYEFAKTEHYPEDTCHTTVDGSKIFCYVSVLLYFIYTFTHVYSVSFDK